MTREAEALELIEAFQAEIEHIYINDRRIASIEELATARAILEKVAPPCKQPSYVLPNAFLPNAFPMRSRISFNCTGSPIPSLPLSLRKKASQDFPMSKGRHFSVLISLRLSRHRQIGICGLQRSRQAVLSWKLIYPVRSWSTNYHP